MKRVLLVSTVVLLCLGVAQAQQPRLNVTTQKNGKQVITTLEPVVPPPNKLFVGDKKGEKGDGKGGPAPNELGKIAATGVVLAARDWRCGRDFFDELGRRWRLISGLPLSTKPNLVSGWIMQTVDDRTFFFTVGGSLFRRIQ